jgi:hypothetical protein
MLPFFSYGFVLAAGITIHVGDHLWSFSSNVIVYLIIAAVVGLLVNDTGDHY